MSIVSVLMHREWVRVKGRFFNDLINNVIMWPLVFAVGTGHMAGVSYFGLNPVKITSIFLGFTLMQMMILAYETAMLLLEERSSGGVLGYHVTVVHFWTLFMTRYLFALIHVLCSVLPFLPVSALIMGSTLVTSHVSWLLVVYVLFLGSMFSVAYSFFLSACITSPSHALNLWMRLIEPLLWVGCCFIPLAAVQTVIPWFGRIAHFIPFTVITESLRSLFLSDQLFLPLGALTVVIVVWSALFLGIGLFFTHRRMDAV